MTLSREDIERDYTIDELHIIRSLGKFEGEPFWVPYFWERWLEGCSDDEFPLADSGISVFYINTDDTDQFPELKGRLFDVLLLWENDQGFAYSQIMTEEEWEEKMEQLNDGADTETRL